MCPFSGVGPSDTHVCNPADTQLERGPVLSGASAQRVELRARVDVDRVAEVAALEAPDARALEQVAEADVTAQLADAVEQRPPQEHGVPGPPGVGGAHGVVPPGLE